MTTYFISRHAGALQWAHTNRIGFDQHLTHLHSIDIFKAGDLVIGTLPINIVHQLNQMHVRYLHLSLEIPPELRGVELNAAQLGDCKATLEEFVVKKVLQQ